MLYALKRKIAGYSDEYGEMQAKIDETVKKLNDLEMMQGVIKDAVKDSAKRGTTFDTTQYKWVQEDIEKLTKEIEVAEREPVKGLKYSDIDKKQNVIHVRRTLKYIEGKGYFEDTPKTRTSTRDIPLTAAITEHIEAQRKYWGFKVVRMDQYLFCNENGDPISRERIQGEIDRIIKRIKSDGYDFPRITSHVFRHPYVKSTTKKYLFFLVPTFQLS